MLQYFYLFIFLPLRTLKKLPPKVAQFGFFISAALTAQNSPGLTLHIGNIAQDTSVYYSVLQVQVS